MGVDRAMALCEENRPTIRVSVQGRRCALVII